MAGILDSIGRRVVRGPAEVPLEAVAMLTLALPIALVRFIDAGRWRTRILYALAACLLMAAIFATYRKSAIVAPAAAVLALLYFRRRALLRFAPLGMVLVVTVMITLARRAELGVPTSSPAPTPRRYRRSATGPPTTTRSARTSGPTWRSVAAGAATTTRPTGSSTPRSCTG